MLSRAGEDDVSTATDPMASAMTTDSYHTAMAASALSQGGSQHEAKDEAEVVAALATAIPGVPWLPGTQPDAPQLPGSF